MCQQIVLLRQKSLHKLLASDPSDGGHTTSIMMLLGCGGSSKWGIGQHTLKAFRRELLHNSK